MAFLISKDQTPPLVEPNKVRTIKISSDPNEQAASNNKAHSDTPVSSQLHLKSSTHASLDRDVVLRRIRHRKYLNRVRSVFDEICHGGSHLDHTWPDLEDAFSSP